MPGYAGTLYAVNHDCEVRAAVWTRISAMAAPYFADHRHKWKSLVLRSTFSWFGGGGARGQLYVRNTKVRLVGGVGKYANKRILFADVRLFDKIKSWLEASGIEEASTTTATSDYVVYDVSSTMENSSATTSDTSNCSVMVPKE